MRNNQAQNVIKDLYNVFDPSVPVDAHDPRYVDFAEVRNSPKILQAMAKSIRFSEKPTVQLYSGHRGCGKTSELNQLIADLRNGAPPYFVVNCEADALLNLEDVRSLDVLFGVARRVIEESSHAGIKLQPNKFIAFWQKLGDDLINLDVTKVDVGNDIAKVGVELKQNASLREIIRQKLEKSDLESYLEAINEIIHSARQQLQAKGYADLVVVVDNLDRVLRAPIPGTNTNLQEEMFITNSSQMTSLDCFVIYTLPPALIHSPKGMGMGMVYGANPQMLPMVPVKTRGGEIYQPGIDKLIEALNKRINAVGASFQQVFHNQQLAERLCEFSGGYIRLLLLLMRTALTIVDKLPIDQEAVEDALRQSKRLYLNGIFAEHWSVIDQVEKSKQIVAGEGCLELLNNLAILGYFDQDAWWDVNPVLRY